MKKTFAMLSVVFIVHTSTFSQLRFHLMSGFANYSGDIQQKRFTLDQAKYVITAGATYDLGRKFSLRSEYSFANLGASDKFNKRQDFRQRNFDFQTIIKEFSLMGEYNIFNLTERPLSPY